MNIYLMLKDSVGVNTLFFCIYKNPQCFTLGFGWDLFARTKGNS